MNAQTRRKHTKPVQITTEQANMLRVLVANLMDIPTPPELVAAGVPQHPSNRIPEMGSNRIDPFMLATAEVEDGEPGENLRDQATALRIIYALVSDNARPTPEAIEKRLTLELSGKKVENAAEVAHELVERAKSYRSLPPDVEFLASALAGWSRRRWIRSRLADMMALVDSPAVDQDVTLALLELLRDITPDLSPMSETGYADNVKVTRDKIREAYQRRQQGKSRGPEYPWPTLRELVPIIQPGHMHVWSAPTKHGKCVTGDTLIPTEFGLLPISSFAPSGLAEDTFAPLDILVQGPDGPVATSHIYNSGIKPTKRVVTKLGYEVAGTLVHPVLTLSRSGVKEWKQLQHIQPGDYVAVQRHEGMFGNVTDLPEFEYTPSRYATSLKWPTLPTQMTPGLAYAMGLLVGDGGLTDRNYTNFSSVDIEPIQAMREWAASMGLELKDPYDGRCTYTIASAVLKAWLENIGLKPVLAHEKTVPFTIMQAPRECVAAFLRGLFDTDAYADKRDGRVELTTTSPELAKQVQVILLQFGIYSVVRRKQTKGRNAYTVMISANVETFYSEIGFGIARKQERAACVKPKGKQWYDSVPYLPDLAAGPMYRGKLSLQARGSDGVVRDYSSYANTSKGIGYAKLREMSEHYPDVAALLEPEFLWAEVATTEDAGMRQCYDFTVPEGHSFVSNGIVSHNTTFANEIGRYIALNQPEYMVVLYHLETDALDLGMREMARELTIKPGDMMNGLVNIDDPGWKAKLAEQDQFLAERVGTGKYAKYKYVHCPSLTLQALEKDLYRQKAIAAAMGWEGVVIIIDYYQIMDWQTSIPKARDEIAGRNEMASKLKDLIERANKPEFGSCDVTVHGIVFAQDSVFDAGRKTPFGGQQIIQRGQVQIQIIGMDDVESDEPVWTTAKNRNDQVQMVDGLGNPLFFHTVGDVHSDRAIHVVRGNQVKPGYAFVQIVNGYFAIYELNQRKPKWWPDYRAKMEKRKKRST